MTLKENVGTGHLAELVKKVQAGNEVLLIIDEKPVAKLVSATVDRSSQAPVKIRTLKGHRVLTPIISQFDIADDMLER